MQRIFSPNLGGVLFLSACWLFTDIALAVEPTEEPTRATKVSTSDFPAALYSQRLNLEDNLEDKITNVSQLKDVSPQDWAYEAVRSLAERYGCIVGYLEGTYRGKQTLSRYEFAASLNACLNQIERLMASSEGVLREDLDTINKLRQEFEAELATLEGRVDNLEGRVAFLEDWQFSPTAKLYGEIVMAATQVFGGENASTGEELDEQVTLNQRTRLTLLTNFNSRDRLRLRLQAGNVKGSEGPGFRGGSNTTTLSFASNTENDVILNKLEYIFSVGENTRFWVTAVNLNLDDVAPTLATSTLDAATGSLLTFGTYAPIYYTSSGAGVAFSHDFSQQFNLVGFYSALDANDSSPGTGLFNGQFVAATQLTFTPSDDVAVGLVYTRNYFPGNRTGFVSGGSGSALADDPFDGAATSSDNLALVWNWEINPRFSLEGWGMYTHAKAQSGSRKGDDADIWNWKLTLAFPDLLALGNLGAFTIGNPPRAYKVEGGPEDNETAWFLEMFYRHQLEDNISITPGVFVITNPEDGRDPLWGAVLRASFLF